MPVRFALVLAGALSLWVPMASAKVHPIFQTEIDRVCTTVRQAKTVGELDGIDRSDGARFQQMARTARHNATFFTLHITAKLELEAAEKKQKDLDVELADRLTPARDNNLKQAVTDAEKALEPTRAKQQQVRQTRERIQTTLIARPGADVSKDQAAVEKLVEEIANARSLETRLQEAIKARDENPDKIKQLRAAKPAVYGAVKTAKDNLLEREKQFRQTETLAQELEETHASIVHCIDVRRVVLDPSSDSAMMQRYLDAIQRTIDEAERRLRATNTYCAQLPAGLRNLRSWAALVAQQARAASGMTPTNPAQVQQHDRVVLDAINGANAAAAEVAQTRARAAKAAADACAAAQTVIRDPRHADALARLADAQRHRTAAELEVGKAAAELQRIRTAYAAAMLMSAQLETVGENPATAVAAAAANLQNLKAWLARLQNDVGAPASWTSRTEEAGQALDAIRHQPRLLALAEHFRMRIDTLQERHRLLAAATDCRVPFNAELVGVAAEIGVPESLFNAIPASARSPAPKPAQSPATIEGIYNGARGVADGTASEATNAVRCVTDATNALKSAPPPPPREAGIKCRYQRPDGSTIEVTIFDEKTCPKDIPAKFVDWKPAPKPDMMQGFEGKWFGNDPKLESMTISGGANVFSIVGVWRSDLRPIAAKHDWTAECKRSAEGTNVAECTGKGKYWDADKYANYTMTLKLSLLNDGKYLHYDWLYGTVAFFTTAGEPRRHNDSISPGKRNSGSMKR